MTLPLQQVRQERDTVAHPKTVTVNEILREAYRRFTKDKTTLKAVSIILGRAV
jgi:hypothetical protein